MSYYENHINILGHHKTKVTHTFLCACMDFYTTKHFVYTVETRYNEILGTRKFCLHILLYISSKKTILQYKVNWFIGTRENSLLYQVLINFFFFFFFWGGGHPRPFKKGTNSNNYFPMGHIHRITTGHQGHKKKGHLFLALSTYKYLEGHQGHFWGHQRPWP